MKVYKYGGRVFRGGKRLAKNSAVPSDLPTRVSSPLRTRSSGRTGVVLDVEVQAPQVPVQRRVLIASFANSVASRALMRDTDFRPFHAKPAT
jgi:hypothetical protein